jgi:hypothetical protein
MTPIDLQVRLDKMPEMQEYRNENASYDDVHYEIPIEVLEDHGYDKEDLEKMNENSHYEGFIRFVDDYRDSITVKIHGAA